MFKTYDLFDHRYTNIGAKAPFFIDISAVLLHNL